MEEAEIEERILEVLGVNTYPPKTIAAKIEIEKETVKNKLEEMRTEGHVEKTRQGKYYLTDNGAEIIGIELPVEVKTRVRETVGSDIKDLILETRESLLNTFREGIEAILEEIRKSETMKEGSKKVPVPSLTEFEEKIMEEYPRIYVDSLDAVGIPELRRRIKVNHEIDNDVFDELLIKLFESGTYKIEEGSGDDGLKFRGRNFMFLKMKE